MEPTYVVVAGGAGLLGAALCAQLLKSDKHRVICLDNLSQGKEELIAPLMGQSRFTFIKGDICEPFLVPGKLTQLYHLSDPRVSSLAALKTRGEGTLKLLERAARDQVRVVVCSASEAPFSECPAGDPHAEALALAFAKERGQDIRVARLASVFGPGMGLGRNVVSEYIETALKRRPIEVEGDGGALYSLLYLEDAVQGLVKVMETEGLGGSALFLGMRRKVLQRELARLVARACGTRVRLAFDPTATPEPKAPAPSEEEPLHPKFQWEPTFTLEDALAATVESLKPLVGPPEPKRKKRSEPQAPTVETLFRGLR